MEDRESQSREAWERMRIQTSVLVNIQLPKNKQVKPERLMKFPWDNAGQKSRPLTRKEREALFGKWDKLEKEKWRQSQISISE